MDKNQNVIFETDDENCGEGWSFHFVANINSDIDMLNNELQISIYPNPVLNFLNIELQNLTDENISITLNSIDGKRIFSQNYKNINTIAIPTNNYSKGIYLLEIITDTKKICRKISLQ